MSDPPRLSHTVAAEIRAELARHRLSARRAAARLGWTQPYLSRRLNGDVPFDVKDIEALATLLGVAPDRFFRTDDEGGYTDPKERLLWRLTTFSPAERREMIAWRRREREGHRRTA